MGNRLQNYYLIHLQYLGFRYHGWQKQPQVKTLQAVVEKTLSHVLGHNDFNILAAGRTDAGVSALHAAFELFSSQAVEPRELMEGLNLNFPADLRVLAVEEVDRQFNIIQNPKLKEYLYLFACGEKLHPFCAPFITSIRETLDLEIMKEGAKLFEGTHFFKSYCYKPAANTLFERNIIHSQIEENNLFTASFFPERSFVYQVQGRGFLRHQVRLMMGTLFSLGKGEITLKDIRNSLHKESSTGLPLTHMAPQNGLMLHKIHFEK